MFARSVSEKVETAIEPVEVARKSPNVETNSTPASELSPSLYRRPGKPKRAMADIRRKLRQIISAAKTNRLQKKIRSRDGLKS